jgi:CspA family cold shock protein
MVLAQGAVKWFDTKKGYGFIIGPQGEDVFVHYSQIRGDGFRSLKDGETVQYELTRTDKGMQARDVIRQDPPPASPQNNQPAPNGAHSSLRSPRRGSPANSRLT